MRVFVIVFFTVLVSCSSGYSQNEDYPVPPKTNELLFYIQRNHNVNTIIYDANFDKDGNLIKNEPINVYWIRYDEHGQKMELRTTEKWYAYGLNCDRIEGKPYYKVKLVADKKRVLWLKQTDTSKAILITKIDNKLSRLEHMYIFADNSGIWPKIKYIELFGKDFKTNKKTYQKVIPD